MGKGFEGNGIDRATSHLTASRQTNPRRLTNFKRDRVLWPSISYAGDAIVFERDFNIFRFDLKTNAAAPVTVALRGVAAGPAVEHRTFTSNVDDLSASHDGKKVAFIVP